MMKTNTFSATNALDGLRDIRPPISIPDYWLWLGILTLSLAVLAALIYVWRRRQQRRAIVLSVPEVPAHQKARRRLLIARDHFDEPQVFCIIVSDTVRAYLEDRFQLKAPERTTEEFVGELQSSPSLTPEQKSRLGEFLERCDLAKFARYQPDRSELERLYHSAEQLIEETIELSTATPAAATAPLVR